MTIKLEYGGTPWLVAITLALLAVMGCGLTASAQTYSVLHNFGSGADGQTPFAGLAIDAHGNLYGTARYGGSYGQGMVFRLSPSGSAWLYTPLFQFNGENGALPSAGMIFGPDGTLYGTTAYGGTGGGQGAVFNLRPQPRFCGSVNCPWNETVLKSFSGYDGFYPLNLAFDHAGNLYGVTQGGGYYNDGVAFEFSRSGGSWVYKHIVDFDGVYLPNGVVPDADGNLYGTSLGSSGTLFEVTNSGQVVVLVSFGTAGAGIDPVSQLLMDGQGNLYGQTLFEGTGGGGTVFRYSLNEQTLNVLYPFIGSINNGSVSSSSLMMDSQGNLYGTTAWQGAHDYGQVFKLSPDGNGGYNYTDLHDFTCGDDGCGPWSNVVMDSAGNLYGTTAYGGANNGGVVWKIAP